MAKLIHEEVSVDKQPILLLFGKSEFATNLKKKLEQELKIVQLTEGESKERVKNETYIDVKKSKYFTRLDESFSFALFFLSKISDKQIFSEILPKVKRDNTKTIVLIPARGVEEYFDILLDTKKVPNISILITGDLFEESLKGQGYFLSEVLKKAASTKSISSTGDDLLPIYPVSQKVAITAVLHHLFTESSKNKISFLFYQHPQTILSAIHLLARIVPELELTFNEDASSKSTVKSHQEIVQEIYHKTLIKTDYLKLESSFEQEAALFFKDNNRTYNQEPEVKKQSRLTPWISLKSNLFLKALIISLPIYLLLNFIFIFLGVQIALNASDLLKKSEYKSATKRINISLLFFSISSPVFSTLNSASSNMQAFATLSKFLNNTQNGISLAKIVTKEIVPVLNKIQNGIKRSDLDLLTGNLVYLYFLADKNSVLDFLPSGKNLQFNYLHTLSTLPTILGYNSERSYLVLFQNNGEIRPSGGFIGSLAEIKLKNGKVSKYEIMDVYQVDGQLKNHIEPHYVIRRFLQPHLYLRDSNFDLDFQSSATKAALLYNLETGHKVDGVISIDFEVLRLIIERIGPITLQKYNKTLDSDNTFAFLQESIESNFFPGSTQKKDLLDTLLTQIVLGLHNNIDNQMKVITLIPNLLLEKHIMFAFREQSIQNTFNQNGLGGTIQDPRDVSNDQIQDTLAINEANIGVNKANTHIKRELSYLPSFRDNSLYSTINLSFTNTGDKDYTAYLRVITPQNSTLESVLQNGKLEKIVPAVTDPKLYENKTFKPPTGLEVDTTPYNTYTTFGFITTVAKNSNKTISISYKNGIKIIPSPTLSYSLFYIKQPGTLPYKLNLSVPIPKDMTPKEIGGGGLQKEAVKFSKMIRSDEEFKVVFEKK